jgi:hypothetical protein
MSKHRKNKDSGSSNSNYNATWFAKSVVRRRKRNLLAKISRRVGRFTKALMRKARKSYLKRYGFLAQGFVPAESSTERVYPRKYMKLRLSTSRRGMNGVMR